MLRHPALTLTTVLFLACAVLPGCGASDQEEAFQEATEGLVDAEGVVEEARALVDEKREASHAAEQELGEALQELEEARAALAEAREAVGRHATDPVLFRAVQGRLLEESTLEDVAIAARVEKGVVELTGSVPEDAMRSLAEEIAADTPGVVAVENRIQVRPPEPADS